MATQRPTVWVLKEQVISRPNGPQLMDYTPAYKYGDLRFITEFDLPLHPNSTVAGAWRKDVAKFLNECRPTDYLILTGQPLAIFMLGLQMGVESAAFPALLPKLLIWKREQGQYIPFNPEIDSPIGTA